MSNVSQTDEAKSCLPDCLCGWCRVGSVVLSDFYIDEAERERVVTKVRPYTDSGENGPVWTSDANLKPLVAVDVKEWVRPAAAGKHTAAIFNI